MPAIDYFHYSGKEERRGNGHLASTIQQLRAGKPGGFCCLVRYSLLVAMIIQRRLPAHKMGQQKW